MTPDQAATLLATYALTGSVSETARQIGRAKSTVSEHLKRANVQRPNVHPNAKTKTNWADAWGRREDTMLALIDEKAPDAKFRDVAIFAGIAADKRYREEHPESVRGGDGSQVIVPVQVVITQQVEDAI